MFYTLGRVVFAAAIFSIASYLSAYGESTDPRAVAIQSALQHRTLSGVLHGKMCEPRSIGEPLMRTYRIAGATVSSLPSYYKSACWNIRWRNVVMRGAVAYVNLGRYVVEKVGDNESGPMGLTITPFRAEFIPSPVGKILIDGHAATAPENLPDGQAVVHRDADGKWVAQP